MDNRPHRRPFRFGVLNINFSSHAELVKRACMLEDLGYDVFHVADHIFSFGPITGMAAAAQATTHLRIGSYVIGNDFGHPAFLAREALALDCISQGRLELGIGSGYYDQDYLKTGIPLDSPGVRISRLEEGVQILKGLLSGETVSFQGKYYNISELSLDPKPVQKPHPPILIGGGSKRVLSLAACQADIVGFNIRTTPAGGFDPTSITLAATQQKVDWVCQAAGERLPNLEFSILVPSAVVTTTQDSAIQALIQGWASVGVDFTKKQVAESPHCLIGDMEQIVDKLQQNREQFGFSYYVIFEDALEGFAPVVKRLAGK